MRKQNPSEQRAPVETEMSVQRCFALRITRAQGWIVSLGGLIAIAILDYATGATLWVGPGYLVFLAIAAWSLGWREATGLLIWVSVTTSVLNAQSLYPYQSAATIWDFAVRMPAVMALILLLNFARNSCEREWQMARKDPLTGAFNRKAFFELAGSIDHSKGWHILAYADLDGLKALNDLQGHARGDQGLRVFASQVKKAIRRDDLFARIGGDEFLVYMPVRDEQAGLTVAHRLHRAMNAATTSFSDDLHCSVGVLILAPGPRSIDRELRAADELMYAAKQNGAALAVASAQTHDGELLLGQSWMLTGAHIPSPGNEAPAPLHRAADRQENDTNPTDDDEAADKAAA